MFSEVIEVRGHLIDSDLLKNIWNKVIALNGQFVNEEFKIGRTNVDFSYAKIRIMADTQEQLNTILGEVSKLGATTIRDVKLIKVKKDKVLPDNFYSTTNHKTHVRVKGKWIEVQDQRMDSVIVVKKGIARCKKITEVKKGDLVVVGHDGVRVTPEARAREYNIFDFMASPISSERNNNVVINRLVARMREVKKAKGKIAVVAGPAVIHTGSAEALAKLIRLGFVDVLLSGNALAVHDIERALFGTSLGVCMKTGKVIQGGSSHHMKAINVIFENGGIENAVKKGVVKEGIMYECVKNKVKYVLAGSIRDDGPLPEVITDAIKAQKEYEKALKGVDMVLILASALHGIAVGNMLPSHVRTVCVDINPATVTKLCDRGTAHVIGIVADAGLFLEKMVSALGG